MQYSTKNLNILRDGSMPLIIVISLLLIVNTIQTKQTNEAH